MQTLRGNHSFFAFSNKNAPALRVAQNEPFEVLTPDCFSGQLRSPQDTLDSLNWDAINPAVGPVAVDGVQPGDLVRIDIQTLEITGQAVMVTLPGSGAVAGITKPTTCMMDTGGGVLRVPTQRGELKLPLRPMLGVIGLAPAEGAIPNGTPGLHGGNMDCTLMGEGASLYLRAAVAGGLFGCGDAHALMGDGEVLVCGAEAQARAVLNIAVAHCPGLPTPFLENGALYAAIASAPTADAAAQLATDNMFTFLTAIAGCDEGDAGRLMSLVGQLKFCQIVDPEITVRFEFPKDVLNQMGFAGL